MSNLRRALALVLVLLFAFTCVELGLWQLRRNHEKRTFNARLLSRSTLSAEDVRTLLADAAPDDVAYRHATATGEYDTAREVVLVDHPLNGLAGHHVVTPLRMPDGRAILVDRGWVPLQYDDPPVADAAPPGGRVMVDGVLFPTQKRPRIGPKLPPTGVLETTFRIDIARLARQFPYPIEPLWLQLRAQDPPQSGQIPKLVPLPTLDAGPHLSYAIQWFLFATAAIVGWVALEIRRRAGLRGARAEPLTE